MSSDTALETVGELQLTERGSKRLQSGHPWIFHGDVAEHSSGASGIVAVHDVSGRIVGSGLLSPRSSIRLRMLKRGPKPFTVEELDRRLADADVRRASLRRGAYRMVHGEADFLPGLFIDRYDDAFAVQATCAGMDAIIDTVVERLVERMSPRAVVLRNNAASRGREGLDREIRVAFGHGPVSGRVREGTLDYEVDLLGEQKTGAFLDQLDNHVRARDFASGRGFDGFTYHGGFALQLAAGGCSSVIAADQSASALEIVRARASANNLSQVETVEADVVELLPRWADAGERFDTLVIDPPAFASTRATVKRALHAYRQLNVAAIRCVRPGGVLITCSCSGQVSGPDFDEMLTLAARDAGRRVLVLESRGAGPDHPVLAGVAETEYLKCRIVQVV